jgi:hypothetical protein
MAFGVESAELHMIGSRRLHNRRIEVAGSEI